MKWFSIIAPDSGEVRLHSRSGLATKDLADRLHEQLNAARRHDAPRVRTMPFRSTRDAEAFVSERNKMRQTEAPML